MQPQTTAALLIIGDEILTGKVQDQNTATLARCLFRRGVALRRVETVPDEIAEIAVALRRMSAAYTWVFTSGGIGPTHDDKTYEAVAQAFGRALAYDESVLARMREHYEERGRGELNAARRRMALLPSGSDVLPVPALWVPVVVVENVYVLPGVPVMFERMLDAVADRFVGERLHLVVLHTDAYEGDIAAAMEEAQRQNPTVRIGSYPQFRKSRECNVMVTLEGTDPTAVEALADALLGPLSAR
ncbi:MAG: competence/damage-inducible protein A, partial [Myxococcota bacterium]